MSEYKKDLDNEKLKELDDFIASFEDKSGILIEVLHQAQKLFGYLPEELQLYISRKLNISGAEVYGVVSFYSFFTMRPPGKYTISVCMGTACFVRGADKILQEVKNRLGIDSDQTTEDGVFTLKDVRCVGACGLAPVVTVNEKVHGRVTIEDVDKIIESYYNEVKSNGN